MNESQIMMYFQTSFRNIGLYSSLYIASLAVARANVISEHHNFTALIVCLIFLYIAYNINVNLINDMNDYVSHLESDESKQRIEQWTSLLSKVKLIHYLSLIFVITKFVIVLKQFNRDSFSLQEFGLKSIY